jgi:hypothetical protein
MNCCDDDKLVVISTFTNGKHSSDYRYCAHCGAFKMVLTYTPAFTLGERVSKVTRVDIPDNWSNLIMSNPSLLMTELAPSIKELLDVIKAKNT